MNYNTFNEKKNTIKSINYPTLFFLQLSNFLYGPYKKYEIHNEKTYNTFTSIIDNTSNIIYDNILFEKLLKIIDNCFIVNEKIRVVKKNYRNYNYLLPIELSNVKIWNNNQLLHIYLVYQNNIFYIYSKNINNLYNL